MLPEIHIEPIKNTDLDQVLEIFGKYYSNSEGNPVPEEVRYFKGLVEKSMSGTSTDPTELYVVAKDRKDNVKGVLGYRNCNKKFLSYAKTSNPLEIYVLFVDMRHIKQGIGRCLFEYIKALAFEKGYTEIIVRSASKFSEGWKFYEKMRFKEVGSIPERMGGESKIFRLIL